MFKNAQVVMLPTNEKAMLHLSKGNKLTCNHCNPKGDIDWQSQHLYIVLNDIIKDKDWYLNSNNQLFQCGVHASEEVCKGTGCMKVIATTDTEISIKRGQHNIGEISRKIMIPTETVILPNPSNSFIKKYVEEYNKGNIITNIMVEYEDKGEEGWEGDDYTGEPIWRERLVLKVNPKDNTITIKKVKDSWNKDEVYELLRSFSSYKTNSFTSEDIEWIKRRLI